ncbi:MAG: hypothetical protein PHO53_05005, partial [Actinomycetota bacterium]|nr:hypothetical protein [Actinomycetota bacterium]
FSEEALEEANTALERISTCLFGPRERITKFGDEKASMERTGRETELIHFLNSGEDEFRESMEDDFNTAAALGVIFKLVREINLYMEEVDAMKTPATKLVLMEGESILTALCETLGLLQGPQKPSDKGFGAAIATEESPTREQLIEMILEIREEARRQKNFSFADGIRKRLSELGVTVEDGRDGFRWRIKH